MKKLTPLLTFLALMPFSIPALAQTPAMTVVDTKPGPKAPHNPIVQLMATGFCGQSRITKSTAASGETLVVTFTLSAAPCNGTEKPRSRKFTAIIDLAKEAKTLGMNTDKPKLEVIATVANP